MTRPQKVLIPAIILLMLSVALFTFFTRDQASLQTFSAIAHRDCAPWDGAAFTVRVLLNDATTIDISIWQSPEFLFPRKFSFPDDTGQVGNAILIHPVGMPDLLRGEVAFQRVEERVPIEGRFDLTSEGGGRFEGRFLADWDKQVVLCG